MVLSRMRKEDEMGELGRGTFVCLKFNAFYISHWVIIWGDFVAQMFDVWQATSYERGSSSPLSDPDNIVVSDVVNILGVSEKQAMEIMSSASSNGNCDGKINFADFRRMMETQEEDE